LTYWSSSAAALARRAAAAAAAEHQLDEALRERDGGARRVAKRDEAPVDAAARAAQ